MQLKLPVIPKFILHRLAKSQRVGDLQRLKEKVDTGVNFRIANTCFSFEYLAECVRSCRAICITVPMIPGIYIPFSYADLHKMCNNSKVAVPTDQIVKSRRLISTMSPSLLRWEMFLSIERVFNRSNVSYSTD